MPTYETVFITPPNLTEDDERATVEALAQIVSQGGGKLIATDRMGRRRLAYPIRKFEDGVYVRFLYDSGIDVPKELERRIRLSDNVLRYLTVLLDVDWAAAAKEHAAREVQRRAEAAAAEAAAAAAEQEKVAAAEAEAAVDTTESADRPNDSGEEKSPVGSAADGDEKPNEENSAASGHGRGG